jgi:hypothetical protein
LQTLKSELATTNNRWTGRREFTVYLKSDLEEFVRLNAKEIEATLQDRKRKREQKEAREWRKSNKITHHVQLLPGQFIKIAPIPAPTPNEI